MKQYDFHETNHGLAILSLPWLLWLVPVVHANSPARDADHSSVITDFILAFIPLHAMGINIRPVYLVFSFLVLHQRRHRERSYGTLELRTSMASHNHHCGMFPLELTNNRYCIVKSTVEIKYLLIGVYRT